MAGSAATRSGADPSSTRTRSTPCATAPRAPLIPSPNRLTDGQYRFNDKHQLPTNTELVGGTTREFRESRLLGATTLDFAFTDLARDAHGRDRARLGWTDRRTVAVWAEDGYRVIELYAGRPWPHLASPGDPLRLER